MKQKLGIISLLLRKKILRLIQKKRKGHLGGTLSILDILITIFNSEKLKFKKSHFKKNKNDILVLSKGHSALALYAVLEYFKISDYYKIDHYNSKNKSLLEHPTYTDQTREISAETGSLGHGLPITAGMAFANKAKNRKNICILGDGELYEGSIWESLFFIGHHKLTNLLIIVDRNKLITLGHTEKINKLESLKKKFLAFNFDVNECDGHNFNAINKQLNKFYNKKNLKKPIIIICNTIKGNGLISWQGKHQTHHGIPENKIFEKSIKVLEKKLKTLQRKKL